jgi:hypothetical protein
MPTDTPTEVQNVADFFKTAAAGSPMTTLAACIASDVLFTDVRAQKINPARSVFRTSVPGIPNGTWSTPATTGNIAGVGTLRTAQAGRDQIANKHIGPIGSSAYSSGVLTTAFRIPMTAMLVAMITQQNVPSNGGVITVAPTIYHRSSATSTDAISAFLSDRVGTMRRRTLRVGE